KDILNGRNVVIVSHSMGGLVTTYWYHKFYSGNETQYPFKLKRVIFIGTPHMGAPSSLANMIEGYSTDLAAGWFFKCFQTNTIFKSLSRAGHTFPSIYQLLPVYDPKLVILKTKTNAKTDVPIFDIESWIKFDWLKKWRDSKQNISVFYKKIQPLLEDGKRFHEEIYKMGPVPNAVYFYSKNYKTLTRIIIHETKKGTFETEFKFEDFNGDGRVPREVAINW
ncbi:MAG: hypothetical protein KKE59_01750, partial [Proteobacteria bacterium]|nr:hypothetical protein [Pseudomonadota bacterium]